MQQAEGTGKTLEEAQQDALSQLGASEDEVEFEVLKRPGAFSGILGGAVYRVRATLKESEPTQVEEPPADEVPHQDLAEAGHELLQQMVDLMGIEGEVHIEDCSEDEVVLNVEGEDMGLLIGRHGATLDAVQLIVAIGANRQVEEGARVIVDAEDYRARHKAMIESQARTLADEARANDKEVVVPDLKAYERRLMHLELKDDPDVETYSEGEGDDRVLVISPVD